MKQNTCMVLEDVGTSSGMSSWGPVQSMLWNSAHSPCRGQLRHAWLGTLERWVMTGFLQDKLKGKMLGLKNLISWNWKCLFYLTDRRFNLFKCTEIKFRLNRKSSSSSLFFFAISSLRIVILIHQKKTLYPQNANLKLWLCVYKRESNEAVLLVCVHSKHSAPGIQDSMMLLLILKRTLCFFFFCYFSSVWC